MYKTSKQTGLNEQQKAQRKSETIAARRNKALLYKKSDPHKSKDKENWEEDDSDD